MTQKKKNNNKRIFQSISLVKVKSNWLIEMNQIVERKNNIANRHQNTYKISFDFCLFSIKLTMMREIKGRKKQKKQVQFQIISCWWSSTHQKYVNEERYKFRSYWYGSSGIDISRTKRRSINIECSTTDKS